MQRDEFRSAGAGTHAGGSWPECRTRYLDASCGVPADNAFIAEQQQPSDVAQLIIFEMATMMIMAAPDLADVDLYEGRKDATFVQVLEIRRFCSRSRHAARAGCSVITGWQPIASG